MKRIFNWLRYNWQGALFFLACALIVPFCALLQVIMSEKSLSVFSTIVAIITIIASVGFAIFVIVAFIKAIRQEARDKYAEWVANSIDNLHIIENRFRYECKEIITNSFSERSVTGKIIVGKYYQEITALEKEYKYNLKEKLQERSAYSLYYVTSVPQYLAEEYQRNITNIADSFRYFGDFMLEQISRKE